MQEAAEAAAAKDGVTALLTYIADNFGIDVGKDGREFGQGVAQLARDIGEGDGPTGAPNPAVAPPPVRDSRTTRVLVPGMREQTTEPGPGTARTMQPATGTAKTTAHPWTHRP